MTEPLISIRALNHTYGSGALKKQILFDISLDIQPGEVVIVTGPSGSGKTTLLTLMGALRSAQDGSLKVLGHELRNASEATLGWVRREIGYVFQHHNLLGALTSLQNVLMCPALAGVKDPEKRARDVLDGVGLSAHAAKYPEHLSGGQRQRVAIARALAGQPRLILADEPTASLDKQSGRDVADLMTQLARERGTSVLLVTHDSRILDIADRIVHLEDGRLASFTAGCATSARQMLDALAQTTRRGELSTRVADLTLTQFTGLLEEMTQEFEALLRVLGESRQAAFESMLEQVLEAFTFKIGKLLGAERATIFVVDVARAELWSKVLTADTPEIRIPIGTGIAGRVAATGQPMNVPDAYQEPLFSRAVDAKTGFRTRTILCMPMKRHDGTVFAVMQLLNKTGGVPFDDRDVTTFEELSAKMSVILQAWTLMTERERLVEEMETVSDAPR